MNNETNSLEVFSTTPISKAIFKNAVPAILAMLMVLVYNLADTFFIGQTHDDFQVAAVSLATPVFLIFMALGTVFGVGGTSVISRTLGQGRKEYAKKVCSFCMWSCVIVGIIVAVLFLVFMDDLLILIGASSETMDFAKSYLRIVSLCGPFVLIANCYSNVIRAEGNSTYAMSGMLIGNLLNVILDPIFIQGFGWDIEGAAVATVIGNIVGALVYILYYVRKKSILSISPKYFTYKEKICTGVLSIGVPAALGTFLMSVSQIIVNALMSGYSDMAVAAMGVSMKIVMITAMIAVGLGQGIQPLLGYCVGAKNWDRFKKILNFSLIFALVLEVILTGLCYIFCDKIVSMFLTDMSAFTYGVQFSKILLTTSILFGIFYVLLNALQAIGASFSSLIINISRQGLIYIPASLILNVIVGVQGIVWAQPLADITSFILAIILYIVVIKKTISDEKKII